MTYSQAGIGPQQQINTGATGMVVTLLSLAWLPGHICITFISNSLTNSFSDSMACHEIVLPERRYDFPRLVK